MTLLKVGRRPQAYHERLSNLFSVSPQVWLTGDNRRFELVFVALEVCDPLLRWGIAIARVFVFTSPVDGTIVLGIGKADKYIVLHDVLLMALRGREALEEW